MSLNGNNNLIKPLTNSRSIANVFFLFARALLISGNDRSMDSKRLINESQRTHIDCFRVMPPFCSISWFSPAYNGLSKISPRQFDDHHHTVNSGKSDTFSCGPKAFTNPFQTNKPRSYAACWPRTWIKCPSTNVFAATSNPSPFTCEPPRYSLVLRLFLSRLSSTMNNHLLSSRWYGQTGEKIKEKRRPKRRSSGIAINNDLLYKRDRERERETEKKAKDEAKESYVWTEESRSR